MMSVAIFTGEYMMTSSVKRGISDTMSLTQNKKSEGPKTEPWETPDVTSHCFDDILFITTCCFLSFKKFSIQLIICSGILNLCNLPINALCETLSNVFAKSKVAICTVIPPSTTQRFGADVFIDLFNPFFIVNYETYF